MCGEGGDTCLEAGVLPSSLNELGPERVWRTEAGPLRPHCVLGCVSAQLPAQLHAQLHWASILLCPGLLLVSKASRKGQEEGSGGMGRELPVL